MYIQTLAVTQFRGYLATIGRVCVVSAMTTCCKRKRASWPSYVLAGIGATACGSIYLFSGEGGRRVPRLSPNEEEEKEKGGKGRKRLSR